MKLILFTAIILGSLFLAPFAHGQAGPGSGMEPYLARPTPAPVPGDFVDKGPPANPRLAKFDPVKARQQAQELADLAQKIRGEIALVSKSVLPKDLERDLKRVQKLAKQLREQVSP